GWALAKDVDARFKNVHSFAHALASFAPPEGQILIERIAQIASTGRATKRGGSVPPPAPSFPSARSPSPMGPHTTPLPGPAQQAKGARAPLSSRHDDTETPVRAVGSQSPPGQSRWASGGPQPATTGRALFERKAALGVIATSAVLVPVLLL